MKIFAISDLHLSINNPKPMDIFGPKWDNYVEILSENWQKNISDDDLVLVSGDISWAMYLEDAVADLQFIRKLNGKIVFIRGNHDYWWKSISAVRSKLPENMYALQNDSLQFDNIIICGTRGWTVPENETHKTPDDEKIYKRELIRLKLALENAKAKRKNNEKLICMLHYPPFNSKRQDSDFTKLLEEYNVNYVVYGHLHGNDCRAEIITEKNGITYHLTSCDLVENMPQEINIKE